MSFSCSSLETCGQDMMGKVLTNYINELNPPAVCFYK